MILSNPHLIHTVGGRGVSAEAVRAGLAAGEMGFGYEYSGLDLNICSTFGLQLGG